MGRVDRNRVCVKIGWDRIRCMDKGWEEIELGGLWGMVRYLVNAVLLKLRPELYQSRYNASAINVKPMDAIILALNVTHGDKRNYQTSS